MDTKKTGNKGNNPKKGSQIRVEPIRSKAAIKRIKLMLANSPLYSAVFCLGINTAFRASDLLSIKVHQVQNLEAGGMLAVKEKKTGKIRRVAVNQTCVDAIHRLLDSRAYNDDDCIFMGQRGVLTVSSLGSLVKKWCQEAGLNDGNYSSHTLRKTWGYAQRVWFNASLPILVEAFNHSSQKQTLAYLGIQEEEIMDLYANEL
ncbi:tyrosine-type recombinase/integrase [Candidatus Woesearchaeota archaeon]|nr:tyrosine-type recombinase/integrase [Candidatus Woesearchaeota archaeon]